MTAIVLTPEQRDLARHALGLPNKRRRSYRNRFVTFGGPNHDVWMAMVAMGAARRCAATELTGGGDFFWLTPDGAAAALETREKLCPEDFPPIYLFRWDRLGRKGQPCRVKARGAMNSIEIVFADGFSMVTSGNAIRRPKPGEAVAWEARP